MSGARYDGRMRRHATIGLGLLLTACTGGKAAEEDDLDEVLGILLTPTEVVVPVGQTAQLSATGLLDGRESLDLTRSVDWRSSDPGVLAISKQKTYTIDTSSTPSFLGLDAKGGLWQQLGGKKKAGTKGRKPKKPKEDGPAELPFA